MAHLVRTLIKGEVLTEFAVPKEGTDKVAIIASGMPGYPYQNKTVAFLVKQGYAVFVPRYRGSWESKGRFLEHSLEKDILDILDVFPNGFTDVFHETTHVLQPKEVVVIGTSFGGPAAFFSAGDPRVTKVIAISPVVDFTAESEDEPFDVMKILVEDGFGEAYRISPETWEKIEKGEVYNPVSRITQIKPHAHKIWIIHAQDDKVCMPEPIVDFAKSIGCVITTRKKGGHIGTGVLRKWPFSRKVKAFLRA